MSSHPSRWGEMGRASIRHLAPGIKVEILPQPGCSKMCIRYFLLCVGHLSEHGQSWIVTLSLYQDLIRPKTCSLKCLNLRIYFTSVFNLRFLCLIYTNIVRKILCLDRTSIVPHDLLAQVLKSVFSVLNSSSIIHFC